MCVDDPRASRTSFATSHLAVVYRGVPYDVLVMIDLHFFETKKSRARIRPVCPEGLCSYEKGLEWLEKGALQGCAVCEFNKVMGLLYKFGRGVEKNIDTAIEWFTKAADKGHFYALSSIGTYSLRSRAVGRAGGRGGGRRGRYAP